MRSILIAFIVLGVWGGGSNAVREATPNKWSDEGLWPVLEAQDHRDTDRLCVLLKDSSAVVREAAAMAMASVQDKEVAGRLLEALADTSIKVRAALVFALGYVADSAATQRLTEAAVNEHDTTIQRAYLSASFTAMQ